MTRQEIFRRAWNISSLMTYLEAVAFDRGVKVIDLPVSEVRRCAAERLEHFSEPGHTFHDMIAGELSMSEQHWARTEVRRLKQLIADLKN